MIAIGAPVGTVSPSWAMISTIVPLTGEGTSALTLSVDTSTKDSYFSTESPTFLSHCATVPSVTVSPSWGIVIVVAMMGSVLPYLERDQLAHRGCHTVGRDHELLLERHGVAHRRHVGSAQPPN